MNDDFLERASKAALRARYQLADDMIKRALVEGHRYVYQWEQLSGETIDLVASFEPPQEDVHPIGNVIRFEIGDGLVIDRSEIPGGTND